MHPATAASPTRPPPRWLFGLAVVVTAVPVVVALLLPSEPRGSGHVLARAAVTGEAVTPPRPEVRALRVLHAWDRRRAAAWASGDADRLARLYLPGSRAGRRDLAMLHAWRGRGATVAGLRPQVLAVEVLHDQPGRLMLRVTDRVVGATALLGSGGELRLPTSVPACRVIELRRREGRWRVGSVRDGRRGGRSRSAAVQPRGEHRVDVGVTELEAGRLQHRGAHVE